MFRQHAGEDLVAQLEFMARRGLHRARGQRHAGPPGRRPGADRQARSRASSMRMGVFVAHTIDWNEPTLTTAGRGDARDVPEGDPRVGRGREARQREMDDGRPRSRRRPAARRLPDARTSIETLKRAAAILEPHGLVMVLEPLNTLRNHPGHVPHDDAAGVPDLQGGRAARRARSCSTSTTSRSPRETSSRTSTRRGTRSPTSRSATTPAATSRAPARSTTGTSSSTSTARASPASSAWSTATRAQGQGRRARGDRRVRCG